MAATSAGPGSLHPMRMTSAGRSVAGVVCALALSVPASQAKKVRVPLRAILKGLWLPVTLMHTVSAGKTARGTTVLMELTQPVPVSSDSVLDAHTRVLGSVTVSVSDGPAPDRSVLQIRLTSLALADETRTAVFAARAIATYAEVAGTASPITAPADRGNPSAANWTTRQIGGDEVYRAGWLGDVYSATMQKVGTADFNGVYSEPRPLPGSSKTLPRALGPFSTSARGLYGFGDAFQMTSDAGAITLRSSKRATLHGGDALLLEVVDLPGE